MTALTVYSGTDSSATTSGEGSASQHEASRDVGDGVTDGELPARDYRS